MHTRKRKRTTETNSLAFLDVISCSFGAIVLLLLILKTTAPDISGEQQAQLEELRQLQEQTDQQKQELKSYQYKLANILERLGKSRSSPDDSGIAKMTQDKLKGQMQMALQSLDEEMRMLKLKRATQKVGGIPADSRHVIFIIDTSGSMITYAWDKVQEQMEAILEVYPQIDGFQIMNDMGEHLFSGYAGRWMKDTPRVRRRILSGLQDWASFSNSNPTEGIYAAISGYARKAEKISLYVMGDDFSGSAQAVLDDVDRLVRSAGSVEIRLHTVGFYTPGLGADEHFAKFSKLTELTRRFRGTFIGISTR